MGPIEVLYIMIAAIIVLISLARGYVRDLGATLIIMVAIFILTFFEESFSSVTIGGVESVLGSQSVIEQNLFLSTAFTLAFTAMVFAGYVGRTLEFPGKMAAQPGAFLMSLFLGLINGYLIAGTLWYYQEKFNYPWFNPFEADFTELAQRMIELLPPAIFENPVFWVVPVAVLLLVRVRG